MSVNNSLASMGEDVSSDEEALIRRREDLFDSVQK